MEKRNSISCTNTFFLNAPRQKKIQMFDQDCRRHFKTPSLIQYFPFSQIMPDKSYINIIIRRLEKTHMKIKLVETRSQFILHVSQAMFCLWHKD